MSSIPAYPNGGASMQSITKKNIFGFRLAALALAGYWLLIFIGTHMPAKSIDLPKVNDKLMHFGAFFGLGLLLCYVTTSRRLFRRFGIIAIIGLSYAAIDEFTQGFVPGRHSDIMDFFADAAGIAAAITVYLIVRTVYFSAKTRVCASLRTLQTGE